MSTDSVHPYPRPSLACERRSPLSSRQCSRRKLGTGSRGATGQQSDREMGSRADSRLQPRAGLRPRRRRRSLGRSHRRLRRRQGCPPPRDSSRRTIRTELTISTSTTSSRASRRRCPRRSSSSSSREAGAWDWQRLAPPSSSSPRRHRGPRGDSCRLSSLGTVVTGSSSLRRTVCRRRPSTCQEEAPGGRAHSNLLLRRRDVDP